MKKIGIITFHASYNCGSMLQAYALQKILQQKYGAECEIINFSNNEQKRMYSILYRPRKIKDVLRNVLNAFFYRQIKRHNDDYVGFMEENFHLSAAKYSSVEDLESANLEYDLYITGSDQVWNINAQDFDDAYFLPFAKKGIKIAYAVSLGATNPNNNKAKTKYAIYLKGFSGISVREKNAQKWIRELTKSDVCICADPTLLLSPSEWDRITGEREVKGKYIFWYTMIYKKDICDIVTQIGKKYNMPIYVLDAKEWSRRGLYMQGIKLAKNGGPSSYLSMVKNAELIITSSFHGTVFCNVFRKNFWYINIHDQDSDDDRASFLLSQLGLQNRYIKKSEILETDLLVEPSYQEGLPIGNIVQDSFAFLDRFCY